MPIIHYRASIKLLVAVRGHPFDRSAFDAMFQAMDDITATVVDQPAAAQLMNPAAMSRYDALVLYDMPGLDFMAPDCPPAYVAPEPELRAGFRALLEEGKGIVALHHALAGWPAWPEFGDWLGGRFLYHPGGVRGRHCLDSGYAHDIAYEAQVLREHPVTTGLPPRFAMSDELYMAEIFADDVTPLLASGHSFTRDRFWSADAAVSGRMNCRDGWDHPPSSNLIGWTKRAINSPLVYLQPGDGRSAYDNPHYRRLLENAIRWVISPAARA
jgi:type 1 glutamine amidotransferase